MIINSTSTGISSADCRLISDSDHIRQSIVDILSTPVGTRVMRPEYGSRLFELVDRPISQGLLADIYAETFQAILKWEPRIKPKSAKAIEAGAGYIIIELVFRYTESEATDSVEVTVSSS